ncbi:MAG: ROK family protein, partial [Victivallaceae bacterium]|nr:ROK family protein [Victivallaceae bacterium]
WGRGRIAKNSMGALFIGHGIGGRFIINGRLFRGARNRAGEVGHIPLRRSGPECKCGLRGCFEVLASVPAIEKKYGGNIPFAEIVAQAESGEKQALAVLHEAAGYMGEAVAVILDITDVDLLVITGDIIAAKKLIRKPLLESFAEHAHSKQPAGREFLVFGSFGPEAGAVGAAAESVRNIFGGFGIAV